MARTTVTQAQRRAHVRIATHVPVRIRKTVPPGMMDTILQDVSVGGIRFLGYGDVRRDESIRIELTLEQGAAPLQMDGRLAWMERRSHSDQYDMGVAFTGVQPHVQRELAAYINNVTSGRV